MLCAACCVLFACRPFDPTKATSDTGAWCWVGLPKSILINGQGNYYNCEDVYKREVGATVLVLPCLWCFYSNLSNPVCQSECEGALQR